MNWKAILSLVITLIAFVITKAGVSFGPDDSNAALAVGLFFVGLFVHDGSVANWRSTLTGFLGAAFYFANRFGLHLSPEFQAQIIAGVSLVIGWLAVPKSTTPAISLGK